MAALHADLIQAVEGVCAHRLSNPRASGKWIVWDCAVSAQTMEKFAARVKRDTGRPTFLRDGKFGVLAGEGK